MSSADVNSVTERLAQTSVKGSDVLSFAGKGLKLDKEEDAKEIVEAINECKSLKVLKLEGNTLGVQAAKAISKALERHPEFERAQWSDMFTGRLKSEIPEALRYLGSAIVLAEAHLVELDLSDNAFGPNGMEGLTELLKSKSCYSLRELRLNNNGLGVTGGKMLAKSLLECHKTSTAAGTPLAIRVFVSGRGRLENEGSMALAEAFKAMGSLEEVSMPQNGINHEGIAALADAFAACTNLRSLNLNDNTFTEKGAIAMAKSLKKMDNVEHINFGDCLLRKGGATAIAEALAEGHVKLKELNLSFNEINRIGANAVAEAMENKIALEKLDLNGNQLGEEGIEIVKGTLESIDKLEILEPFSDDEGTDEEAEDDEEDAEEEPEEDEDGEVLDDPALHIQGTGLTPRPQSGKAVTAEDFLAFPSPTKLQQIGDRRADAILQQIGGDATDIDRGMAVLMKVCSVVTQDDSKTQQAACECADVIMKEMFQKGGESVNALIVNSLLVHLGLLKGEEKVAAPGDLNGPLLVLQHISKQEYFPKACRDILQVFIARPHRLFESCYKSRHELLQVLYQA